jgi:nitrite reductase (NO-forming)
MVHLVLLGALTHSVMVWSSHFAQALLKTPPGLDDRRVQSRRLGLLVVGTAATLVGVPTTQWWLTVVGATLVAVAVLWHGTQLWRRLRKALPGRFRITLRYYLAAAACLPVGAALGATLARGLDDDAQGRILLAHTSVNVLGWVGLTVTGTLVTLWPTMLRTRIDPRAEARARRALPVLAGGVVLVVAGALADVRWLAVAGLVAYAVGLLWWAGAALAPARTAPPREFAPSSVGLALAWWVVGLAIVTFRLASTPSWSGFDAGFGPTTAVLVVGFAAQLLTGALSYLMPVALGGGARVVQAAQSWFDRAATARLATINLGLVVCLLPVAGRVRTVVSLMVLLALASFLPLMVRAIIAAVRAKRASEGERPTGRVERLPSIWSGTQLVAALATLALAVGLGVALGPSTGATATSAGGVAPTGHTTTVAVSAQDMRFVPSRVTVPRGDRLVVELTNADPTNVHDLQVLGQRTARLHLGKSAVLDVGVVGESTQGWCTVVGHRQMGMVLDIVVAAGSAPRAAATPGGHVGAGVETGAGASDGGTAAPPVIERGAAVEHPADPVLAALAAAGSPRVHRVTLIAREVELEVAPGVTQKRWTFNGQVPGPTLRGRVGDTFEVTLVNDGSMGHSIDFHAAAFAPDAVTRTIPPGESLRLRFTAARAGIWMYHCSSMPMSAHIAAGMHGAVVIEPAAGLPRVDREYLLVQSEVHLQPGTGQGKEPAAEVLAGAGEPTFVTFNGIANQYDQHPLRARVHERVRIWVLDAGPNLASAFHVVGGQFDTVQVEGAYRLGPRSTSTGSQTLGLHPSQGGFVELAFPEAGHYPFISHAMVDAERGAHGVFEVTS